MEQCNGVANVQWNSCEQNSRCSPAKKTQQTSGAHVVACCMGAFTTTIKSFLDSFDLAQNACAEHRLNQ